MKLNLGDIADQVHGTIRSDGRSIVVSGVSIDSREVLPGQLFVPIVADRDGHDFIEAARNRGAVAWLSSNTATSPDEGRRVSVADTTAALQELGKYGRLQLPNRIVGITGSVGKTSTKDLLGAIIRVRGSAMVSAKSFNNELGVPLTLLNAPDDAWAGVVEMGARGPDHIRFLCDIARPTIGVITNIGTAHLEMFGTRETIADSKSELIASLPADGAAVLNFDSDLYARMASHSTANVVAFSADGNVGADVRATDVVLDDQLCASFQMILHDERFQVSLAARGRHQVGNALAAAAAAFALGSTVGEIQQGLSTSAMSPMRMELVTLASGAKIINDTYNANPVSMRAALDALSALPARRRIAVIGTMAELGPDRDRLHQDVTAYAKSIGIETVLSVCEPAYGVENFGSLLEAATACATLDLGPADAVLVKGSRVAELERLVKILVEGSEL
jgi:UDP-N-acetylmuramoyl-tripeptide--D-alanyl-D-alanine ligase